MNFPKIAGKLGKSFALAEALPGWISFHFQEGV